MKTRFVCCRGALFLCLILSRAFSDDRLESEEFGKASQGRWQEVFFDSCAGDWTEKWFLDGEIGSVETSEKGMQLTAGPRFFNDDHHMVLWTKKGFQGDLKIEFEYTRLDFETRCVNILYIQATGRGQEPYTEDISVWSELRRTPAMRMYFDYMNTYHISFAAFPNFGDVREQYIRGRRYMPDSGRGLKGTGLHPEYFPKGLFEPGVMHRMTVIKRNGTLFMRIDNREQEAFFRMENPDLPPVTEGRIGLRHMYTRSGLYKNIRISQLD
jgi:hypothetical protein